MTIIHKKSYPHTVESGPAPRSWMGAEWAEVPTELEAEVWACLGYCDITLGDLALEAEDGALEVIPDGVVTAIVVHEVPPPPEPEPTADQLLAALMEGYNDE